MVALNTELKKNGGSEHQIEKNDSKRRNWEDMAALNAVTKKEWWLLTANWKEIVALNVKQ